MAAWGVSGVVDAPPLEPIEAESAPGELLASLAFWARRARLASRALFSSSPLPLQPLMVFNGIIAHRLPEMSGRLPEKVHNVVLPDNVLEYTSDGAVECQRKMYEQVRTYYMSDGLA